MKNTYLRYGVIGGLFLLPFIPLIFPGSLFFPFITGKNFAFRILVEIVFAIWVVLAFRDKKYRPQFSWLGAAFTLFVIVMAIADSFGQNPFKSFWSNYERMEGWITLIHLLAYFFVASTVLNSEKLWNRFFNTTLLASGIVCIYGFYQLAGKIPINQGGVRLDATFGNAAYLAGYMLIHIILTLIMAWRYRKNSWAVATYGVLLICELVIIYYTATRGAILGLIGGVALALLLFSILGFTRYKKEYPVSRNAVTAVLIVLVLVVGFIWSERKSPFVLSSPALMRITSISSNDAAPREMIWAMAWKGFTESPKTFLIGWGQESFNFVFNKYYDPHMWPQEKWFDRAHNVFFDWLTAGGILGLLGYLSLFFFAFWYIWKSRTMSVAEKSLFSGLLVGYFFHNFFVFDNLTSYILFATLLAYFHSTAETRPIKAFNDLPEASEATGTQLVLPIAAVLLALMLYVVNMRPLFANIDLLQALQSVQGGDLNATLADFKKVFAYDTFATGEALEQLSSLTINVVGAKGLPDNIKQGFFALTQKEFVPYVQAHSNDARYEYFYGSFLDKFGLYSAATPYLEKARVDSPNKQDILFELGTNYYGQGQLEKAFTAFKTAYELDPTYTNAHDYFVSASQSIFSDILKRDPKNIQAHLSLLNVYVELGDKAHAIAEINTIIQLDPTYKQKGQDLINKIQAAK